MQMRPTEDNLEAPQKLLQALRGLPDPDLFIPTAVDDRVLAAARRHLAPRDHLMVLRAWLTPSLALASVIVFLLVAGPLHKHARNNGSAAAQIGREDLNADGQVDILDAFALARLLRDHGAQNPSWDINGDGIVDARDIEAIAAHSVAVGRQGRS